MTECASIGKLDWPKLPLVPDCFSRNRYFFGGPGYRQTGGQKGEKMRFSRFPGRAEKYREGQKMTASGPPTVPSNGCTVDWWGTSRILESFPVRSLLFAPRLWRHKNILKPTTLVHHM